MATLKSGRKVSIRRQARRALRNGVTIAAKQPDAEKANATLLQAITTADSWLSGTHEKLAGN
jgi:lysylphosphatidylglycerol synthetase-like protein (DUF2156 family)